MKNLIDIIQEKLKINKDTKIGATYTDEELRKDWNAVYNSFSLSDKKPYKQKYGVDSNKKEDIQQAISLLLRDNRHKKDKFDENDVHDFYRMNIPDTPYRKSKDFFDKEPIEFIEYLKSYFENESEYFKRARAAFRRFGSFSRISIADRHQLNMYNNVTKYLEENQ